MFQQVGGTPIDKKHAPPLACLGAGKLEKDVIYPSQQFHSLVLDDKENDCEEERFYKRFILSNILVTQDTFGRPGYIQGLD